MSLSRVLKFAAVAVVFALFTSVSSAQITPIVPAGCTPCADLVTSPHARVGEPFEIECEACDPVLEELMSVIVIGFDLQEPYLIPDAATCTDEPCYLACSIVMKAPNPTRLVVPSDPVVIGGCFCVQCEWFDPTQECFYFGDAAQICIEGACETAFGKGDSGDTCFLDIDEEGSDFERWGWTNELGGTGVYELELWAAAGQCDTDKGTLVGSITIDYDDVTGEATVSFSMLEGYTLEETHVYIGSEILPRNNGGFTVAPGQYPYSHEDLDDATSDVYEISGLTGSVYFVGHAVVCGL